MMSITNFSSPVRVLIADDSPEVRSALRLLLENENQVWQVVGEAADLGDLRNFNNLKEADLLLLDWELPGFPQVGERAAETITDLHKCCAPKVIAFSGYFEARGAAQAAGVDAFISKIDPPDRVLSVLKAHL